MSTIHSKRILHELDYFHKEKYYDDNYCNNINNFFNNLEFVYGIDNWYVPNRYHLHILYKKKYILNLIIPKDYPFKPYIVHKHSFTTNINFNKYLYSLGLNIESLNKNILSFFYTIQYCIKPRFLNLQKEIL